MAFDYTGIAEHWGRHTLYCLAFCVSGLIYCLSWLKGWHPKSGLVTS